MRLTGWLAVLIIALATLYMTAPNPRRGRMKPWRGRLFAHRGLHDIENGVVENTLPAFEAACESGYGMELDIQFTRDFEVVVFHDDTLKRLTGDPRRVSACTLAELKGMRLMGVEGAVIPTLRETLDLVDGRTPLLIELKSGRNNPRLCRALMERLQGYEGEYLVESFNPLIVAWFRRNAPQVVRGQLVCPMRDYAASANQIGAFLMAGLLLNGFTRPDFVAYNANARRFFSPHFQRFAFRTPMAAWTVRSEAMQRLIEARGEISIFEKIRP
ncbi:MAG: glycerophosphodiester phosphodiesterase [Clostridia bacterium]|nr:glycerophosphodiester phosphodiesterase [Clostridia bacterium]